MDFSERYGPWAVVAGASEGVGLSVARLLGQRRINVVLVAREQDELDAAAGSVASETRTVALDLSTADATAQLAEATADLEVGLLVYNAGGDPYGSPFLDKPAEVWQAMVRRNCVTVLGTAHHYGEAMAQRGRGAIVLVTSGSGWAGARNLATYGGTKAFDLVLGEGLWAELAPLGVDVLSMVLGPTDTPAYRRLLDGRPAEGLADPDDVALVMLDNLGNGPTYPAGPSPFGTMARRDAVQRMSSWATMMER